MSLAVRWLLPRLSDFYRLHPDTSLAIETVATEVVEPASDSDAYIQYLPQPPNDSACLTLFEEQLVPVCAPGLGAMATMEDLLRQTLLHRSVDKHDWRVWLAAHSAGTLDDYRHLPFNLDELALDAAARGLGVAMTDLTLASESIDRGILVVPLGQPLATGGVYALCLQPMAASHPGCAVVMEWFGRQAQH